ncbi:hypothetical protein Medea1_0068 [Pseudomonas phage Medea1]|uniref:Uncharacterized protein n=1 Tax=Pseudomonas phage Medea1 TaxID=2834256 RepID=A0A8E7FPR3_9CAUD|nr:hypothetical protein QIT78_gp68 [Pseudomonas phage Medea1]QVW29135.1 hypothetical protein Medea1_0068 [Pseudomonas phage Medea1]
MKALDAFAQMAQVGLTVLMGDQGGGHGKAPKLLRIAASRARGATVRGRQNIAIPRIAVRYNGCDVLGCFRY